MGAHDLGNSRRQDAERLLGPQQARQLTPVWSVNVETDVRDPAPPPPSLDATPIVAAGCVYVATAQGAVEALDADSGTLVWTRRVKVVGPPATGGTFVGAPAYHDGALYLLVNEVDTPYALALNASNGAVEWRSAPLVPVDDYHRGYYTNATPVVTGHVLIAGFSAAEGDEKGHGGFTLIEASTGAILQTTYAIPRRAWADGCPDNSAEAMADEGVFANTPFPPDRSCAGGGVWTTPAVDTASGYAFMGTGNPFNKKGDGYPTTNAIIKVDVDRSRPTFGRIVSFYSGDPDQGPDGAGKTAFSATRPACYVAPDPVQAVDAVPSSLPSPLNGEALSDPVQQLNDAPTCGQADLDFGAPQLLSTGRALLVGDLQKSGIYHLVDAATMGRRHVVQTQLSFGCDLCNGSSPAFDRPHRVIAALPFTTEEFDPATAGPPVWADPRTDPVAHYEPVSVADGVVYEVGTDGTFTALDEGSGIPLLVRSVFRDGGLDGPPGSSGIAIARHTVYVAAGNHLIAYRPSS
jgi:outer membrane protein assembly factor BamB